MTEEDIRARLVAPYLNDLGFDISEISFEDSFSIRLGKKKYAMGRSDILCKRHNKNLFVVELKNDTLPITQEDIDQGISYARLLDDIAPFTIISNGRITKIFDSISKKELSGKIPDGDYASKYGIGADEEVRIRYEALKSFISLSPDNLKTFCEAQVYDRMGAIVGNIDSPYSKFVSGLHVHRKELQTAFEAFITSSDSVFGLVGSAGVGKTSALCALALSSLGDNFVFFYNAAIIESPIQCIAQDLNMAFSSRTESDIVLKKLDELGRYSDRNILIFVDAIDENINPRIAQELSELANIVKDLDKIKVVVSCKSNIWDSVLKMNGTPTHLYEELCKSHSAIVELNNNPCYLLKDFSANELRDIIPLYQKAFDFKGELSGALLEELKNGFFLKIFSEVYSGKEVPTAIKDKDLIGKYLKQSLDQSSLGFVAGVRHLAEIGKVVLKHEYDGWAAYKDEGLDIYHFLEMLNLSLSDNIPEDLFTRNILIKSNKQDSYNVSFYYSKIRDYIICFHSYKLDKLTNDEFYNVLSDFYRNHIGKSALDFYIENASQSHIGTIVKFKKDKALQYVNSYNLYLETNFKIFKNKFDPYTKNEIGIILPKDLIKEDGYALVPLERAEDNKIYHENIFSMHNDNSLIWEKGIHTIYSSNASLLIDDQTSVVKKNVFGELEDVLKKGRFSAYSSEILLLEKASLMVYFYHKKLGYTSELKEFYLPRYDAIYPIDLNDLKEKINRFRYVEFYKYKCQDQRALAQAVDDALKDNPVAPQYKSTGDVPPFEELYKIVEILMARGYQNIDKHYLPLPDKSIDETKRFHEQFAKGDLYRTRMFQFSESQIKNYIEDFFRSLELCYREFVEECFPTFKDQFSFYSTIPHEYFFYIEESETHKGTCFGYRPSRSGKFEINFRSTELQIEAFKKEKLKSLRGFHFDQILRVNDYIRYPVQTVDRINTRDMDEYCVIRNWIYKFLESDMENLFKEVVK